MPLPVIADVYRCTINQTIGLEAIANVIHVEATGTFTLADLADDIQDAWEATNSFIGVQSSAVDYVDVVVQPLDGTTSNVQRPWQSGLTKHGTAASTPATSQSALVYTLQTGLSGRSRRGRLYLCGPDRGTANVEATRWDLTQNHAADAGNNFAAALAGGSVGATLHVASYVPPGSAVPVINLRANDYIGTQRRRSAA